MSGDDGATPPPELKRQIREMQLRGLRNSEALDTYEVGLFTWYLRKTESLIERMATEEYALVQQQLEAGAHEPNDSGLVALSYYASRVRYSHIIYLASLLEVILRREAERLTTAIGEQNAPFAASELKGDLWTARKKTLERYGHFQIPPEIWAPIRRLLNVRNVLVHNNGATDTIHPDEIRSLAKIPGIRTDSGELEIGAEYVRDAFSAVKQIAEFLQKKVGVVIEQGIQPRAIT